MYHKCGFISIKGETSIIIDCMEDTNVIRLHTLKHALTQIRLYEVPEHLSDTVADPSQVSSGNEGTDSVENVESAEKGDNRNTSEDQKSEYIVEDKGNYTDEQAVDINGIVNLNGNGIRAVTDMISDPENVTASIESMNKELLDQVKTEIGINEKELNELKGNFKERVQNVDSVGDEIEDVVEINYKVAEIIDKSDDVKDDVVDSKVDDGGENDNSEKEDHEIEIESCFRSTSHETVTIRVKETLKANTRYKLVLKSQSHMSTNFLRGFYAAPYEEDGNTK